MPPARHKSLYQPEHQRRRFKYPGQHGGEGKNQIKGPPGKAVRRHDIIPILEAQVGHFKHQPYRHGPNGEEQKLPRLIAQQGMPPQTINRIIHRENVRPPKKTIYGGIKRLDLRHQPVMRERQTDHPCHPCQPMQFHSPPIMASPGKTKSAFDAGMPAFAPAHFPSPFPPPFLQSAAWRRGNPHVARIKTYAIDTY